MNMLETLRMVRGAVNDRNLISVLTHVHIVDGTIYGGNGRVTIQAPFPKISDDPVTVPAKKFLQAVDACEGDPILEVAKGALTIMSKVRKMRRFRLPLTDHNSTIPITSGR